MLLSREVIYTDDVEHIFGKRPWVSRTDEILKINEEIEKKRKTEEAEKQPAGQQPAQDGNDQQPNQLPPATPPPFSK